MPELPNQNQLRAKPRLGKGRRAKSAAEINQATIEAVAADAADALQTHLATSDPTPDTLQEHIEAAIREAFRQLAPTFATTPDIQPAPPTAPKEAA